MDDIDILLLILCSVLSILTLILFFQPRWIFSLVLLVYPGVTYFIKTNKPVIAITIDDGPDAITTPKILETLSNYGAKATFFIISSRVRENDKIVSDIISNGHEIGNHLTEDKPSIKSKTFEIDLLEAHKVLSYFAKPHWLRPASGWYNSKIIQIADKYGYQVALGSIFPYDTHIHSSCYASMHILANARPGSIIVLHDCGVRGEKTSSTLKFVLPELKKRGYDFVTMSEISRMN